ASQAVSDGADAVRIDAAARPQGRALQQRIEEKAEIRDASGHQSSPARPLIRVALTGLARQLRRDRLGMIERGDHVSVAAQVFAEKTRGPPAPAARVRVDGERPCSRSRGRPDLAREPAGPGGVIRLEGLDLHRKYPASEWIISGRHSRPDITS